MPEDRFDAYQDFAKTAPSTAAALDAQLARLRRAGSRFSAIVHGYWIIPRIQACSRAHGCYRGNSVPRYDRLWTADLRSRHTGLDGFARSFIDS